MKFFVMLISLLMIVFGCIIWIGAALGGDDSARSKVGYESLSSEDKCSVDMAIVKLVNASFIATMLGVCLFIAGLFI